MGLDLLHASRFTRSVYRHYITWDHFTSLSLQSELSIFVTEQVAKVIWRRPHRICGGNLDYSCERYCSLGPQEYPLQ